MHTCKTLEAVEVAIDETARIKKGKLHTTSLDSLASSDVIGKPQFGATRAKTPHNSQPMHPLPVPETSFCIFASVPCDIMFLPCFTDMLKKNVPVHSGQATRKHLINQCRGTSW
jgi:hypothetical protein